MEDEYAFPDKFKRGTYHFKHISFKKFSNASVIHTQLHLVNQYLDYFNTHPLLSVKATKNKASKAGAATDYLSTCIHMHAIPKNYAWGQLHICMNLLRCVCMYACMNARAQFWAKNQNLLNTNLIAQRKCLKASKANRFF